MIDTIILIVTLLIGWLIWSIIVWGRGQSPGKQILGMRVLRSDSLRTAGRGLMFGRGVAKMPISFVANITTVGIVLYFWLCWDRLNQELWDKMASTIVVNDPEKLLDPRVRTA